MKNVEEDVPVYDDIEAVKFIVKYLANTNKVYVADTKVEYIFDVIYEYYEDKGLIEDDTAEEADIDEEDMLLYAKKCIKKDKIDITEDEIMLILEGEYEYGKSIGVYN